MSPRTAKAFQLEPNGQLTRSGTRGGPMRPICGTLKLDSGAAFTAPLDAAGPATWTTALSSADLVFADGPWMDDQDQVAIASDILTLPGGIWMVEFDGLVQNTAVANDVEAAIAITVNAGATVLIESMDFVIAAASQVRGHLAILVHLPDDGATTSSFEFKVLQRTDPNVNPDINLLGHYVGTFTKMGNADETTTLDG